MKAKNAQISFFMLALIILTLACGLPSEPNTEAVPADATEAPSTGSAPPPTEPAIQHNDIPVNLPGQQNGQAGDFDSSKVIENDSLIGGDRFTFGRFERPFNANTMDIYFSQLDIVDTKTFQDDVWIYASLTLKELSSASSSSEKYAVELDTNINGKGDWLIITFKPESTEWVVKGVQIFQDTNSNVGLDLPSLTDEGAIGTGDGFETKVFDQGQGNDPDSAWVRISPNDSNTIEFAIKKSVIGNPTQFMINMWAGNSLLDASLFDINDQFTHEQAGAADEGLEYFYPIKEVAEIDNSCKIAVGFQPTGAESGICPVPQQQAGDPVPPGTSCPANTFLFCNQNGCFCFPIFIVTFPTPIPPVP
ncbi:MAG TPA: hypothetical protein DIW23_11275 [Anaerolineae bacterium]|nr:hypothetical protein [Anaerolineae bacterium]